MVSLLSITILCMATIGSQGFSSPSFFHSASKTTAIRKSRSITSISTTTTITKQHTSYFLLKSTNDDEDNNSEPEPDNTIDIKQDPRLYRIKLPRATGIEWGTDLSFSFVYVRNLEPGGAASLSCLIDKGDQICELRPISSTSSDKLPTVPLIGASFDGVMNAFANLTNDIKVVEMVFFHGTKDELKELCASSNDSSSTGSDSSTKNKPGMVTITVIQNKGAKDEQTKIIEAKEGANVRQTLVDNGINVYQSLTRWTNCKGKQLCGTCIVNIADGSVNTNRKSMDEGSTLRENPESYRLSCVTFAYGDVTVETFPPIEASQWTR